MVRHIHMQLLQVVGTNLDAGLDLNFPNCHSKIRCSVAVNAVYFPKHGRSIKTKNCKIETTAAF